MSSKSSKKKKSGGSPLPIIIIVLIIGGVAGSNFVGPAKGWMTGNKTQDQASVPQDGKEDPSAKTGDSTSEPEKSTEEKQSDASDKNSETAKKQAASTDSSNKSMTEFEKKHKEFFDEYMSKAKKPEEGRRYPVVTINNDIRDGILKKVDEYSIHLEKVKPYNANTSIHFSMLRPDMAKYFFPEKAANTYANKMLEKYLAERNVIAAIEEEMGTPETEDKTADTTTTVKKSFSSSFKAYDTAVTDSSPRLAHAAMEVNNYLKNQVRITKKRDKFVFADVEKCHAKQQGSSAVFYMYVTPQFVAQNMEYRFQVIDGIRRFWALRCMSNGVAGDSRAFLCIVLGDNVVGGSKITKADDIYVK